MLRRYRFGDGAALFARAGAASRGTDAVDGVAAAPPARRGLRVVRATHARRVHAPAIDADGDLRRRWRRYLGGAGFHVPDWNTPKVEIGYFLVPPARGTGIASDVVRLQIHYAFDQMQMNRIWGACDAANDASTGVMRRAGMREEGLLRAETRDHHGQRARHAHVRPDPRRLPRLDCRPRHGRSPVPSIPS